MAYQQFSPIPVVSGGTGLQAITSHNIIVGNGTGTPSLVAPSSTSGVALISQGSSANPVYGTVVVAGGGTGAVTLTGLVTGNGTSAMTASAITQFNVLVGGASNAVSSIAPGTAGIPLVSGGASSNPAFGTALVVGGGTGIVTTTAYAPILAGTTSTGAFQQATTNFSTSGFVLTSTGSSSVPTWQAVPSSSSLTVTSVAFGASPYTVLTTDQFLAVDSSGGVVSLLLPDAPSTGRVFYIKDSTGSAATNNITVTTVSGTDLIDGATSYVINTNYQSVNVVFDGAAYQIW